jgi:peptidoglycan hydrolase CwlO-like protein
MRYWLLAGLIGLMAVPAARADGGQLPPQAAAKPVAAQASLTQAQRHLVQHQAEVKRLDPAVASQESDSKRASERLQQQDQAIAELQKQLDALRAKSPASQP